RLPRCLADRDQLRVPACILEQLRGAEPVVQHDVRGGEELPAAQRDQVRIAGAGPDEPRLARAAGRGAARTRRLVAERLLEHAFRVRVAARGAMLGGGARDEVLPETAPGVRVRDRGAHALAPAPGEPGECADPGRNEALDDAL